VPGAQPQVFFPSYLLAAGMGSRFWISFSLLLTLIELISALKLPFHVRTTVTDSANRLRSRADISGQTTGNTTIPVANTRNAQYITNITMGGQPVAVMLDTGSSDLWVTGSVPGTKDTGKAATLSYAVGKAAGNINLASLTFDNYTVNEQAFLLVTDTSSFSTDIRSQGYAGLVGLGPNSGSVIRKQLDQGAVGDTVLNRIFQQNKTSQNYISFLLDRAGDPKEPFKGQLTISEPVPGFENITSFPKLSVEKVQGGSLTDQDQHWQVLTDKDNGIIGPDGQPIKADSLVSRAPSGRLVAVIDSGFTFPQVSRDVSDHIYGRVKGAVYDVKSEIWTVPCDQYLSLSFNIGGHNFPIHPLDVVSIDFNATDKDGRTICLGTFQPITSAFSLLGEYDIILGMAFLRNSYTLLDFGNFVDSSSNDRSNPYVQLMPVTNADDARKDFIQSRLNGVDTTNDPSKALLPPEQMQHSPQSSEEKKQHMKAAILSRWPYILVGCLAFLIITVGLCIWRCCCRRRGKRTRKTNSFIPMTTGTSYVSLSSPGGHGSSGHHAGGGGHHGF
jgi:hypothetical protein